MNKLLHILIIYVEHQSCKSSNKLLLWQHILTDLLPEFTRSVVDWPGLVVLWRERDAQIGTECKVVNRTGGLILQNCWLVRSDTEISPTDGFSQHISATRFSRRLTWRLLPVSAELNAWRQHRDTGTAGRHVRGWGGTLRETLRESIGIISYHF